MPLNIKNPEVEDLARRLAKRTGETLTQAVRGALRERLRKMEGRATAPSLERVLLEISDRCSALPDRDARTPDEILGYDADGLPT